MISNYYENVQHFTYMLANILLEVYLKSQYLFIVRSFSLKPNPPPNTYSTTGGGTDRRLNKYILHNGRSIMESAITIMKNDYKRTAPTTTILANNNKRIARTSEFE